MARTQVFFAGVEVRAAHGPVPESCWVCAEADAEAWERMTFGGLGAPYHWTLGRVHIVKTNLLRTANGIQRLQEVS